MFCYALNALMHYFFMRKVCKAYLDDIKPYNPNVIMGIAATFMGLGFLYIPTYSHPIIRYSLTVLLLIILVINRKRMMEVFSALVKKKES